MEKPSRQVMIIAGELSGDLRAAGLAKALRSLCPTVRLTGVGGPRMKENGVELFADIDQLSVVGFIEVIKHYKDIKKVFDLVLAKVDAIKPDAVVLVDYPGFNLRLAKKLKGRGIKVIYYISPQVWAWKENRVEIVRKFVDRMLVLFSFEKDFYARYNMTVDYVGHPLVDEITVSKPREELLRSNGLSPDQMTVGLLPGSRKGEIEKHLSVLLQTAEILYKNNNRLQFIVHRAPSITEPFIKEFLKGHENLPLKVIEQNNYDALNAVDACIAASGTATLEIGLMEKPVVVMYKTSLFTYILARLLIKIPYLSLVNIAAGKKIVPECIQFDATPPKIAAELESILNDPQKFRTMKEDLSRIKTWLGKPGASLRAAEIIRQEIA